MSAQDNAVLARRIYQLFSEDKLDQVLELVSADAETVLIPFGQTFHGREGFLQFMQGFKVVNGKVVETWLNADILGMLQQLGVVPSPG